MFHLHCDASIKFNRIVAFIQGKKSMFVAVFRGNNYQTTMQFLSQTAYRRYFPLSTLNFKKGRYQPESIFWWAEKTFTYPSRNTFMKNHLSSFWCHLETMFIGLRPIWMPAAINALIAFTLHHEQTIDIIRFVALDNGFFSRVHLMVFVSLSLLMFCNWYYAQALIGSSAPLRAFLNTRLARGYLAEKQFQKTAGIDNTIRFYLEELEDVAIPLGWILSGKARWMIDQQLSNHPSVGEIGRLIKQTVPLSN